VRQMRANGKATRARANRRGQEALMLRRGRHFEHYIAIADEAELFANYALLYFGARAHGCDFGA
jgi:hypothetical protein